MNLILEKLNKIKDYNDFVLKNNNEINDLFHLSLIQKWLRDKYNYHISIEYKSDRYNYKINKNSTILNDASEFETYEIALSHAILFILTIL